VSARLIGNRATVSLPLTFANHEPQIRSTQESASTPPLSLHGLAHLVHDFGVTGGLRGPYVSVRPRLPDKYKTAHSSRRSRQIGKMLVVLRDRRKLFGVVPRYGATSYTR
jgi:hypothetical protein